MKEISINDKNMIKRIAEKEGYDPTGNVVCFNGEHYYVDLDNNWVDYIEDLFQ